MPTDRLTHPDRIVDKPWGYELIWAHTERYVGKVLHIKKGESLSYQYHNVKDETIRLLPARSNWILKKTANSTSCVWRRARVYTLSR